MRMSMGDVAAILGASCGAPEQVAQGYSIDSRTVEQGQLFFAIRGPRFDGHEFVQHALERGAIAAVVEWGFLNLAPRGLVPALISVRSPTDALQRLALAVRRKWGGQVVAITGSAGKSTCKELVAALLSERYAVLKSSGNLNNQFGLPLTLLELDPSHQVAVVELAMSAPGEIARLARVADPQVGVVTNVAPVHLQFFDSVDSIAKAKRELLDNMSGAVTAVLNFDDPRVRGFADGFSGRVITFGFGPGSEFQASNVRLAGKAGSDFNVSAHGSDCEFHLPLFGSHNIQNALAAIATASLFEIPTTVLRSGLANFQTLAQRGEILTLPGEITVINDSYNSNPLAMERMLETLGKWPGAKRRIVVAGEMLELGPASLELHRGIGRGCVNSGVDWVVAVQGDARYLLGGALEAGLPADQGRFFSDVEGVGEYCASLLRRGDVVLVKGSRGVHLEKVIELLQSHQEMLLSDENGELKG